MVAGKPVLSSSEIYRWVYIRGSGRRAGERWSVFAILFSTCRPVEMQNFYGAWLWRLRDKPCY